MSARKIRPKFGDKVVKGMSVRDIGACLGLSTGTISRWKRLAQIPRDTFEAILADGRRIDLGVVEAATHIAAWRRVCEFRRERPSLAAFYPLIEGAAR